MCWGGEGGGYVILLYIVPFAPTQNTPCPLTPLQLEPRVWEKILESSIGRGFGGSKGASKATTGMCVRRQRTHGGGGGHSRSALLTHLGDGGIDKHHSLAASLWNVLVLQLLRVRQTVALVELTPSLNRHLYVATVDKAPPGKNPHRVPKTRPGTRSRPG